MCNMSWITGTNYIPIKVSPRSTRYRILDHSPQNTRLGSSFPTMSPSDDQTVVRFGHSAPNSIIQKSVLKTLAVQMHSAYKIEFTDQTYVIGFGSSSTHNDIRHQTCRTYRDILEITNANTIYHHLCMHQHEARHVDHLVE